MRQAMYTWVVTGEQAIAVARHLQPYSKIKQNELSILLQFMPGVAKYHVSLQTLCSKSAKALLTVLRPFCHEKGDQVALALSTTRENFREIEAQLKQLRGGVKK
jgi:hypothetical protein